MRNSARRRLPWAVGSGLMALVLASVGCTKSGSEGAGQPAPKYEVADDGAPTAGDMEPQVPAAPIDSEPASAPVADQGRQAVGGQLAPAGAMPVQTPVSPPADSARVAADSTSASGSLPSAQEQIPQPPPVTREELDAIAIPEGTPEEQVAFIDKLTGQLRDVQDQIQEGRAAPLSLKPVLEAIVEAGGKVLATDAEVKYRQRAAQAKAGALLLLVQVTSDQKWRDQFRELATALAADKQPEIEVEGRSFLLAILAGEILQGKSQDVDGLMKQVETLVAHENRTVSVLTAAQQACDVLGRTGRTEEARKAFELVANAFKGHADPALAAAAEDMFEQLAVVEAKLSRKMMDVMTGREGAAAEFTDAIIQLLQRPNPGLILLRHGLGAVPVLEQSGHVELAVKMCDAIKATYGNSPNAELRQGAQQSTDVALRRLALAGKPLALDGTTLDGAAFDFAPYQGKVVLVAFWASVSPACRKELLEIKKLYEKYQAQGFAVIGVCVDRDLSRANQLLRETQLPWTSITNPELSERFGIERIPYLMLTDQQGNVSDLFVAVSTLDAKLQGLLGGGQGATQAPPVNQLRQPDGE